MENVKLGQESAFANGSKNPNGMSKRFYAACAAMQGLLANPSRYNYSSQQQVLAAYRVADELLKQENE